MSDSEQAPSSDPAEMNCGFLSLTKFSGLSKQNRITCAISANQWDLYYNVGRDDVAAKLSAAFEDAVNQGLDRHAVARKLEKLMSKYSSYGAADSEPLWMLERMLSEVFSS